MSASPNLGRRLCILPEPGLLDLLEQVNLPTRDPEAVFLCPEEEADTLRGLHPDQAVLSFGQGNLTPGRTDLPEQRRLLAPLLSQPPLLLRRRSVQGAQDQFVTWLRLVGATRYLEPADTGVAGKGVAEFALPSLPEISSVRSMLLKTCGGIGNVILTTHLAAAALRQGWTVHFCPLFDAPGFASLANLFEDSGLEGFHVHRPEGLGRVQADLHLNIEAKTLADERDLCHNPYRMGVPGRDADFHADFFFNVTGLRATVDETFVGGGTRFVPERLKGRIVVCPGSKRGWDPKRWPHMDSLLRKLPNPVVLCREDDLDAYRELDFLHPITAPNAEYVTDLDLADAAALLRYARMVVANDCGPAHMAAAVGAPTLILFGPSHLEKNRHHRPNVRHLDLGLDCQPCQGKVDGPGRLAFQDFRCGMDYRCLADLSTERILQELAVMDKSLAPEK